MADKIFVRLWPNSRQPIDLHRLVAGDFTIYHIFRTTTELPVTPIPKIEFLRFFKVKMKYHDKDYTK